MKVASRKLIEDTVSLIEDNLKNDISLDTIAEQLCISKFHLHRMFGAVTGKPLMTYVRNRKLTSSLMELLNDRYNIIDIACEYHFDYEQSYERAFKQLFGITPTAFRHKSCELSIVPRMDLSLLSEVSKGLLTMPFYRTKARFHLAGIRTLINHKENYDLSTANSNAVDFCHNHRKELMNRTNEHIYYGLVTYYNFYEADYYMPSVEVSQPFEADRSFTCQTIERSDYAVFRYVGLHSPEELTMRLLCEIYEAIENLWMQRTEFELLGQYHFERINQHICRSDYCEADIYYPIRWR